MKFKINDEYLSPATDEDIKKYLTTKFFVKSNNDGIEEIEKLDVADFKVNGITKVTPCPKKSRSDCEDIYNPYINGKRPMLMSGSRPDRQISKCQLECVDT